VGCSSSPEEDDSSSEVSESEAEAGAEAGAEVGADLDSAKGGIVAATVAVAAVAERGADLASAEVGVVGVVGVFGSEGAPLLAPIVCISNELTDNRRWMLNTTFSKVRLALSITDWRSGNSFFGADSVDLGASFFFGDTSAWVNSVEIKASTSKSSLAEAVEIVETERTTFDGTDAGGTSLSFCNSCAM